MIKKQSLKDLVIASTLAKSTPVQVNAKVDTVIVITNNAVAKQINRKHSNRKV